MWFTITHIQNPQSLKEAPPWDKTAGHAIVIILSAKVRCVRETFIIFYLIGLIILILLLPLRESID